MHTPSQTVNLLPAVALVALALSQTHVQAGTSSASFQVGIRIGPPAARKATAPAKLRYTCGAAASVLAVAGYTQTETLDCTGSAYAFRVTRNGKTSTVSFNANTGKILP